MAVIALLGVALALLVLLDRPRVRPAPRADSLIGRLMRLDL